MPSFDAEGTWNTDGKAVDQQIGRVGLYDNAKLDTNKHLASRGEADKERNRSAEPDSSGA